MILKDAGKRNGQERAAELSKLKRELEVSQKRMSNGRLLMLDGSLDAEDYRSAKSLLEPEIEKMQRQIKQSEEKDPEEDKMLEYGLFFLSSMNVLFDMATPEEKFRFLGSTFPEKFDLIQ